MRGSSPRMTACESSYSALTRRNDEARMAASVPVAADAAAQASAAIVTTDIPARLDRLRWGRFHTLVVVALGITWILDGLEVTLAGAISPALKESPHLKFSNADVGLGSSAYLAGAVLGALFFGWLTDRLGRKRLFFVTLAVYLIATAAAALADDPRSGRGRKGGARRYRDHVPRPRPSPRRRAAAGYSPTAAPLHAASGGCRHAVSRRAPAHACWLEPDDGAGVLLQRDLLHLCAGADRLLRRPRRSRRLVSAAVRDRKLPRPGAARPALRYRRSPPADCYDLRSVRDFARRPWLS